MSEALKKSIVARIVQEHNFAFAKLIQNGLRQKQIVIEGRSLRAEPAER